MANVARRRAGENGSISEHDCSASVPLPSDEARRAPTHAAGSCHLATCDRSDVVADGSDAPARWYDGAASPLGAIGDHDRKAGFERAFADAVARTTFLVETARMYRRALAARRTAKLAAGEPVQTRKRKSECKPRPDPQDLDRLIQNAKAERCLAALRWSGGDGPMEILPAAVPRQMAGAEAPNPNILRKGESVKGLLVGGAVNGVYRPTVRIVGFRSRESRNLGLLCARLPKGKKMRVGNDKANLRRGGRYSCLSRGEAYVRLGTEFLAAWRVELDSTFEGGVEDLRRRLLAVGLPWLPHLVVYEPGPLGEIVRPHLYFLLPPESAVWNQAAKPLCRKRPRALFRAIHRGLTDILMPVGADPGGLSNPHHGKNPLSHYWHVAELETAVYPTMSMWAQARRCDGSRALRLGANVEQMLRAKAAAEASRIGHDASWSNELFSTLRGACFAQIAAWKASEDPRYSMGIDDRDHLTRSLLTALGPRCADARDPAHAARVLDKVAPWVAKHWIPRNPTPTARGRDAHLIDVGMAMDERQAVAGSETARMRREASVQAILTVLRSMGEGKVAADKKSVATAARVSLSTVQRCWATANARLESEAEALRCGSDRPLRKHDQTNDGFLSIQRLTTPPDAFVDLASSSSNEPCADAMPTVACPEVLPAARSLVRETGPVAGTSVDSPRSRPIRGSRTAVGIAEILVRVAPGGSHVVVADQEPAPAPDKTLAISALFAGRVTRRWRSPL